tara:strand:+ start:2631 stop:5786 length:3156 start_codon:yes stop_codon:yes gene_type:complete
MTGIRQQIPNYGVGGINEQPDALKFPGQVKDVINALPDATYGLFKRPGTKRIGTAPLENVQAGGTFFHYYRDETEGSYIGQIDATGLLRIWSCTDGSQKNVWYQSTSDGSIDTNTSNATYKSNFDNSIAGHGAIKSYLTAGSTTENIQTLTINDSTYINNRTVTVQTAGVTTARPHKNWAYVEVTRTENGRQYGMNIYDTTAAGSKVTISRATRIAISSDTLDEGNGTGSCPGIGTQVFTVGKGTKDGLSAANARNLIFRITTNGQSGVRGDHTGGDISGDDYQASYSRQAVLLHGGEGWYANNTTGNVTLTAAKTSYDYDIIVKAAEQTSYNANIKAVRPEPTPFDGETAVTIDTVLGGITAELTGATVNGNALQHTVIGNGVYIYTAADADDFNIEGVDIDLMNIVSDTVNDVTLLPKQCKHGVIIKVNNSRMSDEDDYYVKFVGENNTDGKGSWIECAEPGIVSGFNLETMPHILQRQANGDFLVKTGTYPGREVGDNNTNPIPSFSNDHLADGPGVGKQINKVLFFRNRIAFLASENVILARPGTAAAPNFWGSTALAVSASDPIDISSSSTMPSDLYDGIDQASGLLVFSTNQQFLLSADESILNPDTAKLRPISRYNYNELLPPISLGTSIGFVDNTGRFSRFIEIADIQREQPPTMLESSKVVPSLIPNDVDLITSSKENGLVMLGKTNNDVVICFKYLRTGKEQQQSSWFKWKFNNPLRYHFVVNETYYVLDSDNFLQSLNIIQDQNDISIDQDGINYLLHIDNYVSINGGSHNTTTNLTTFTNKSTWIPDVTTPNGKLVVVDSDPSTSRVGRYAETTLTGNNPNDDFTVPGNWSETVDSITITNAGSGYTSAPTVAFSGGGGTGAAATATITGGAITAITITDNGRNYTSAPTISITGGGGSSGAATCTISSALSIGYLYDYQVDFPRIYVTRAMAPGQSSSLINNSLVIHRIKLNFGKIGLYETTLTRLGKPAYTEVYESTDLNQYGVSDAPYLEEKIKTIPVYEKNKHVDIQLKSTHPAPATLHSMSWEGDYTQLNYKRV